MKRLLAIVAMTMGMNASVAFAQHENMPKDGKMSPGEKMPAGDHARHARKKAADAEKKPADTKKKPVDEKATGKSP